MASLIKTALYRRNLVEPAGGEKYDPHALAFRAGASQGIFRFGRAYLGREMLPDEMTDAFPDARDFVKDGELMVDGYRAALHEFFALNPDKTIFTLDTVPYVLRTDSGRIVSASSWQHRNLETGELIDPNHASVILTRNPPIDIGKNPFNISFLLSWHELGHLPLGVDACGKNECIHSHPPLEERAKLIEEKAAVLRPYEKDGVPVCLDCDRRMKEFRSTY